VGFGGELRGCLAAGCWARKLMGNATSRFADYRNFCLCLCDFGDKSHDHTSTGWAHSISASRGKKQPLLVVKRSLKISRPQICGRLRYLSYTVKLQRKENNHRKLSMISTSVDKSQSFIS
jgi:hypothetical protein